MKKYVILLVFTAYSSISFGQGTLKYNNLVKGNSQKSVLNFTAPINFKTQNLNGDTAILQLLSNNIFLIETDSLLKKIDNFNKDTAEITITINELIRLKKTGTSEKSKKELEDLRNSLSKSKEVIKDLESNLKTQLDQNKKLEEDNYSKLIIIYKNDSTKKNNLISTITKDLTEIKVDLNSKLDSLKLESVLWDGVEGKNIKLVNAMQLSLTSTGLKANVSLDNVLSKLKDIDSVKKEYNDISILIQNNSDYKLTQKIKDKITETTRAYFKLIAELQPLKLNFETTYNSYVKEFNEATIAINKNLKVEKQAETEGSLLGNITKPLNDRSSLIPELNLFASKATNLEEVGILAQAKLFLAGANVDTNTLDAGTKYFIPEASQLGFMADITVNFIRATNTANKDDKKLGFNLGFYYLQKQLVNKDIVAKSSNPFSVGAIQIRTGFEYTLIPQMFAIYARANGIATIKGNEEFESKYNGSKKMEWFSEFGLYSYLNLTKDKTTSLLLELRFIPVNAYIKNVTNTTDNMISLVKLGIVKDFKF